MGQVLYANDIKTVIANVGGITALATSLDVSDASKIPALSGGDYLYLTLVRQSDLSIERVKATGLSGSTLTIVRAQEGTTALALAQNDRVLGAVTKGLLDDYRTEMNANIAANAVVAAEASNAAAAAAAATDALTQVGDLTPINTEDIADAAIKTAKIDDAAVTSAKIAASAVGSGLTGGAGSPVAVNVDNSTLEVSGGYLRIKTGGINPLQINGGYFVNLTGAANIVPAPTYNPTNPYTSLAEASPFFNTTKGVAADAPVFANAGGWMRVFVVFVNAAAHAALVRIYMGGSLDYFLGTGSNQGIYLYERITIPANGAQYVAVSLDVQPGGFFMFEHLNYNGAGSCGWPAVQSMSTLILK